MTPRVSVTVMAHPSRAGMVAELVPMLDREPYAIVWDRKNDRWDTGRRSLLTFDPAADYTLVIQDDTIPCKDLVAGIERALPHVPERSPLMLYVGRARPHRKIIGRAVAKAETAGDVSWLVMAETYWGPALVIPTGLIAAIVAWGDENHEANYDRRIGRWFRDQQIPVYASWPSLVEHREGPSLVKGRNSLHRVAHQFIGTEASALDVDWSGAAVDVPDPRGPARGQRSRQKPTPGRRPFPARVGYSTKERPMDRTDIIARLTDLPDAGGDVTFDRIGRAVAGKWLLGPVDVDDVDRILGVVTDMAAAVRSSSVALEFYELFDKLDETYPATVPEAVSFEARPVRSKPGAAGRPFTYRSQAVEYLRSRKGGWLTTKARGTGLPISVERVGPDGAVTETDQ